MFVVSLILALIFVFLYKVVYSDKINVLEIPQTKGTIVKVVVNDGITEYYVQFHRNGEIVEAKTRRHRVIGRKFGTGDEINIRYTVSSAGGVMAIIDEEGYALYDKKYDKEAKIVVLMAKICSVLAVLTLLWNLVSLFI